MNTSELIERFSRVPTQQKIGGFGVVCVFFGVVFFFMFYSPVSDKAERLSRQIVQLQQDKTSYEEKQQKYNLFRAEVNKLLEEQKELVKILPADPEISSFLQSIHAQAELAGLNILTFEQRREVQKGFYAMIPVTMAINGTFHQITKFFYSVGQLKRIVNIQNLKLDNPQTTEQGVKLRADFVASTFRFLTSQPAPGSKGKAGG